MSGAMVTVLGTLAVLAAVTVVLERGRGGVRELALIAALGAVAGAGRVLTAPIPSVQPVTLICLVAGAALGVRAGLAVGPVAALVSNGFLGQGPWTPGQMALWALVGLTGALAARPLHRVPLLTVAAALWGVLFGWGMNLWELATFGPDVGWAAFTASTARSIPFDVAGAVGNAVLAMCAGAALLRLLGRYAERSRFELVPSPVPASVAPESMASTRARSSRWLNGLRM